MKIDGEPAIVTLKQRVKQDRTECLVMEESPVEDSQSNGAIERTIQQVQGQIRFMKEALESRIGRRITGEDAIFPREKMRNLRGYMRRCARRYERRCDRWCEGR